MQTCRNLYLNIINHSRIDKNPNSCTGFAIEFYNYQTSCILQKGNHILVTACDNFVIHVIDKTGKFL